MIRNFKCKETKHLFERNIPKKFPQYICRTVSRKLEYLNAAIEIGDLKSPPGNHLEKLSGKRKGQYSIRINDQWRICFLWKNGDAYGVEAIDYH
ncbi:plasmid maintenance system killer family protein [Candidatus Peregrinibacteria bacterium CG_4_10_14_0_2_um_filter_43_11]|nr:MAG: plasmid maintenance system killer family protein [Candidatus Peregrinibacteria bacterium CG_4_10_14_0_2_um_filter_43_11]